MEDKHTQDIETLLREIQQLKFELKAADETYEKELQEKDKAIVDLLRGYKRIHNALNGINKLGFVDSVEKEAKFMIEKYDY